MRTSGASRCKERQDTGLTFGGVSAINVSLTLVGIGAGSGSQTANFTNQIRIDGSAFSDR